MRPRPSCAALVVSLWLLAAGEASFPVPLTLELQGLTWRAARGAARFSGAWWGLCKEGGSWGLS